MDPLFMLYQEVDSIFAYRDGEPPSKRAYDYLYEQNVAKPYDETAMQRAVKHLIGRAWDLGKAAGGGSSSDALSRASDALDDLIEAFNELMPQEDGDE